MKTLFTCFFCLFSILLFSRPCPDDNTAPVILGDDLDTMCNVDLFSNPYSDFITVVEESECGLESVLFSIVDIVHGDCDSNFTKIYTVNWIAEDKAGNQSTFQQVITIQRPLLEEIEFPQDTAVHCRSQDYDSTELYGEPTIGDVSIGMLCSMRTKYNLLDTMSSMEPGLCQTQIRKEWIVLNCAGEEIRDTQFINLIDTLQPIIACSTLDTQYVLTVEEGMCCAEFIFPYVNASDYCTAREDLVYRYTINGEFTGKSDMLIPGTYEAAILVSDECMNTDTCYFEVEVLEQEEQGLTWNSDRNVKLEDSRQRLSISDKYDINVYWNGNEVSIDSEAELKDVVVYDFQGRLIHSAHWDRNGVYHLRLPLTKLRGSGIFIVRIKSFDSLVENVKLSILK